MELFHGAGSKQRGFGHDDIDDTNAELCAEPGPRSAPLADSLGNGGEGLGGKVKDRRAGILVVVTPPNITLLPQYFPRSLSPCVSLSLSLNLCSSLFIPLLGVTGKRF